MAQFSLLLQALVVLCTLCFCFSVDRSKFRKCSDTGFCRRYRDQSAAKQIYSLDVASARISDTGQFVGTVSTGIPDEPKLNLIVSACAEGAIRVKISEDGDRWAPTDLLAAGAFAGGSLKRVEADSDDLPSAVRGKVGADTGVIALSFEGLEAPVAGKSVLVIDATSLSMELFQGGDLTVAVNGRNLLHYEVTGQNEAHMRALADRRAGGLDHHGSPVDRHGGKEVHDYGEDGLAIYKDGSKEVKAEAQAGAGAHGEESIHGDNFGGHKDSQVRGPVSVGMDFSFPFAQHVYGIPEHTSPLSLPTTTEGAAGLGHHYSEPYRLYNLDVFEYELDQVMALYGHIPLMLAHGLGNGNGKTAGVFWFNPSETFIDITDEGSATKPYKSSHWISESGNVDFFLLPGPSPGSVYSQYTKLTGTQQLPPMFSLGYHQCRWNYRDERDVAQVEAKFEELDYPVDVIWLDIEHTDGKRYFTWDKSVFPNPEEMQRNVSRHGRKMVTIVDPHMKRDNNWPTHKEATSLGYYVKNAQGNDFDGWCWPGSSSYLDFTAAKVREWWAEQFSLSKYLGSTMDLFTWNDMNEPSVFNGPEVSMPKDVTNLEGVEHREWHNLYGIYMQMATALGLQTRAVPQGQEQQRPFVLTRAFWAGSQRHGAMWTGDNTATWGHLKISSPMLLSINLAGLSFAGADVGGFFGEPDAELFTRWYQVGAFTPFFRGHAHLDTKRREPWVFGEPYTAILRKAAMTRYSLLPYWYTIFYQAYSLGQPVMRTMWSEFPGDAHTFTLQNQWMLGSALLVAPVLDAGQTSVSAYLPKGSRWFHLDTLEEEKACSGDGPDGGRALLQAPLDHIPVLVKGGSIVPRKMRLRRSSKLMLYDPYTVVIAPNAAGEAIGQLYLDDESSLAHETKNEFNLRRFTYRNGVLECDGFSGGYERANTVERVLIAGVDSPKRVVLRDLEQEGQSAVELVFFHDHAKRVLTLKKPDVRVDRRWAITLEM